MPAQKRVYNGFTPSKGKRGHHQPVISWKCGAPAAPPAPFARNISTYVATSSDVPEEHLKYLVVGAMWYALIGLQRDAAKSDKIQHVVPFWSYGLPGVDESPIKKGSLMIYAGCVRVDEKVSETKVASVKRHTFVSNEGMIIVNDLINHIAPVK